MVAVGRVYDEVSDASRRVLVDRLWPRGFRKDDPRIDEWMPEVAPSTELRHWYGHRAEAYDEFARRYEAELAQEPAADGFARLAALVRLEPTTLLTATREVELSHLTVLADLLARLPDDERAR
ncbi:DUF488 domain-containing protein [Cellulomonas persica]|uniref:MarR family transcriptional regulator n=1 Tax=Cellulomonas persica TaxID=76861 RepID=A0A510UT59_9CELL|nr:DUF488 family protein [Cellulomonas persica]GEK17867.1 hypothetical protein CPE01_16000 [Cellulomonas persica]